MENLDIVPLWQILVISILLLGSLVGISIVIYKVVIKGMNKEIDLYKRATSVAKEIYG